MKPEIIPVSLADANAYIRQFHRHSGPVVGHKFSIGLMSPDIEQLLGIAIVGRPVARHLDDGWTLEVTRVTTEGAANACSALYGAAWRAARALGYRRLVTYTLASESGSSLRAAGWRIVAERAARKGWTTPSRPRLDHGRDGQSRLLWEAG